MTVLRSPSISPEVRSFTPFLISLFPPEAEITADSELIEDLDISSMDVLFLISSLEEEFHISVLEKEIRKMVTVGDVAQVIQALIK